MAELISGHIAFQHLRPTTYNARLAAARQLLKWLGHRWPEHQLGQEPETIAENANEKRINDGFRSGKNQRKSGRICCSYPDVRYWIEG